MKSILDKIKICFFSLVVFTSCDNSPVGNWEDPRVILISIDGFRGGLLKEKRFEIECPNLSLLMKKGRWSSQVKSVFPSLTYPSHTSMISGVLPEKHGITNNRVFNPEKNFIDWFWYADSIKKPTLITKAREKGLISLGISWPVTVGAQMDYLLPEFKSVNDSISTVDLVRKHDKPSRFLELAKIRGTIPKDGNPDGFNRDLLLHQIFMDTFIRKKPNLSLYHMIETDIVQHKYGKNSDESWKAFAFMDSLVGNIISLLDKKNLWSSTTLIITGDHGFKNYNYEISLNKLFEEKGWLKVQGNRIYDWKVVALSSGGSAFIHLNDPKNEKFKQLVRIALSQQSDFEILEKRHMAGTHLSSYNSDFVLLAKKGYTFVRSIEQPFIKQNSGGAHGGNPIDKELHTGFIAAGRLIDKEEVGEMMITDVAHIVASILGFSLIEQS